MQQTKNVDETLDWLRDYANHRINSRLMDERRTFSPHVILDLGNRGILGMLAPKSFGGLELQISDITKILEQFGAIDTSLGLFVGLNNILGIMPIVKYAGDKAKQEILPKLAMGRELAAFAITEPNAGSNPLAIKSYASFESANSYKLFGTKSWSGSSAWAGIINVFVRVLDEKNRDRGITGFILKQGTQGLRQGNEELTMGMRGMIQNTIYLEGASVTSDCLLGQQGGGMDVAQDTMMYGRLGIGALCLGAVKRCLQLALRYADKRVIATGKLLDNSVTLMHLSDIVYSICVLENLLKMIVIRLDNNEIVPKELFAICKILGSEFLWDASDRLVQLLGGRGYIETNIAPQIMRDARVLRIFEGPTETLYCFLGSKVLNSPDDIYGFLSNALDNSKAVERVKDIIEKIKNCNNDFIQPGNSYQYNTYVAGKILAYLLPVFILQFNCKEQNDNDLNNAIKWLEFSVEKIIFKYVDKNTKHKTLSPEKIIDLSIYYGASIGDIEQTMAGENSQIDPMIKK